LTGIVCLLAALASQCFGLGSAEPDSQFKERVLPLLTRHCHECHSHAAKKSRGDLVLDSLNAILTGGQSGPAIVPGEPEKSLLLKAVRHESAELKMPSGKPKLAEVDIAALAE